jgi:predicted lipoprotein
VIAAWDLAPVFAVLVVAGVVASVACLIRDIRRSRDETIARRLAAMSYRPDRGMADVYGKADR